MPPNLDRLIRRAKNWQNDIIEGCSDRARGMPLEFVHRIERVIVHPGDNLTMEAQIEESVQRIPISVLGSLGSTRDASHEELWL
ncbi:hypothetical protein, partial [Bradyrhizobium sp. 21]|uniref:hypothetical protein n=1 Tax=Bradyrhizobium sp. 21 TaxID=2782666 RepID=UPI001FF9FE84